MGFGNMNKMMKQVQKMQADIAKMQEEMAAKTVDATAGGGVVKVTANGKQEIMGIKIDPAAVDPEDLEMLEDMITAAVNEAIRKSQEMVAQEMSRITGGMKIPGLF